MSDPIFFNHFSSQHPILRLKDISPFPFVQELIPKENSFIYDLQRLVEHDVDLETNLLWCRVPSLDAVVFFRWQEVPEGSILDGERYTTSPNSYESSGNWLFFENNVNGTGQPVEIEQGNDILNKLFILVPCSHTESQEFYNDLVTPEGRVLLQEDFMATIGAGQENREDKAAPIPGSSEFIEYDEGLIMRTEEVSSWLQGLERAAASDEKNDPPPSLPSTPVRQVEVSLPNEREYDSSDSEEASWIKVRVGGRLRNQRSLVDLTPTSYLTSIPVVERSGSPS